nr:flagellar biosynthetic protein FliO [Mesobacillus harenae]
MLAAAVLIGPAQATGAEDLNNSVKDYFNQPENEKNADSELQSEDQSITEQAQVGVTFSDILRMIVATVFVVGLLYFLLKFMNKRSASYKSSQLVENLGGTSLGANKSVQIVKAGSRLFVVGVGEDINLLKEIDDPEEYQQILTDYNQRMDQNIQPGDVITKWIKKMKSGASETSRKHQFSTLFQTELDEMSKGRQKAFDDLEKKGPEEQ